MCCLGAKPYQPQVDKAVCNRIIVSGVVFSPVLSFRVFASQLGNMHSDLPPFLLRPNCLKDPVAPNEEHKRYSFENSSAYTVCFSFKQVICLQARWIAGLHG